MRIGINLLALNPKVSGGMEFYLRNLLDSLFEIDMSNQFILFTNRDNHQTFAFTWPNVQIVLCGIGARPQWKRIAWEQLILPSFAKKYHLDLLHSPTYTWPVSSNIPGVVSILDMLYRVYPETIPRTKVAFWRIFVPWSARRCRKILTISESSKRDIVRFLGVPPGKVTVTPLALDRELNAGMQPSAGEIERVCAKHAIQAPYLLYVGGVGRHKNPLALVKALVILRERSNTKELSLVISGNDYGSAGEIMSCACSSGLEKTVRLPGYVAREDMPALYAGAFAYVTPSVFEGFGLTVLEAMVFHTPVVISDRASLPEVAGNAALIVDPERPDMIADAVSRIASDPGLRQRLIDRGLRRVAEFSWERTARLTLEAYREATVLSVPHY
jgi:glycosyltransferase involved in cell wall biosynthesis